MSQLSQAATSSRVGLVGRARAVLPRRGALPGVPRAASSSWLGNLADFRDDRIPFMHRLAREYGDSAVVRIGLPEVLAVSSPALAHELLVEKAASFEKSAGLSVFSRPLLGDGLVTSEHGLHQRQRRLVAPLFTPARIAGYAADMVERAERAVPGLLAAGTVDAAAETMRTTLDIVGKTLFDAEIAAEAETIGAALEEAMRSVIAALTSVVPLPPAVPTPKNLRMWRAVRRLDAVVFGMIAERRARGSARNDLLSLLLSARDEDGSAMSDRQVRDEAMTLFLAGHETTANALVWALYLLAKNPEVRTLLEAELDHLPVDRALSAKDMPGLAFTRQVLEETMRLYPPAYLLGRVAIEPTTLGGVPIAPGQVVFVNIAGLHRRPELWSDPDRFDPARFGPERAKQQQRHAYLPFGAGPRVCIGNHFALMEAALVLATWCRKLRFDLVEPDREVALEPLITLRPRDGIRMRVTARG